MFANLLSKNTRSEFAEALERQKQQEQQKMLQQERAFRGMAEYRRQQQMESQVHNQAAQ